MWVVSVLYFLVAVGMLVINFAQCSPAATQWGAAEGTCWDRGITVAYALVLGGECFPWCAGSWWTGQRLIPCSSLLGRLRLLPRHIPVLGPVANADELEEEAGVIVLPRLRLLVGRGPVPTQPNEAGLKLTRTAPGRSPSTSARLCRASRTSRTLPVSHTFSRHGKEQTC